MSAPRVARLRWCSVVAALLQSVVGGGPPGAPGGPPDLAAQEPGQRTFVVVIAGVGGERKYSDAFYDAGRAMTDAARRAGLPDADVVFLAEDPARDTLRIRGRSTRETVEATLAGLAKRAGSGDRLFVVLLGHGSAQGGEPRFGLPGPDMSAADFARALSPFRAQQVAFVNTASASGDFLPLLSGRNRVIVTATKSGHERNETMFPRFFVRAFAGEGADVDKDGRISVLEAYTYARREVARAYEEGNRLLTEHAQLDDNGDRTGSAEPDPQRGDGALAGQLFLAAGRTPAESRTDDPALAALHRDKRDIEARIEALKRRKASLDSAAYERELETLLVELASTNKALRERAERKP